MPNNFIMLQADELKKFVTEIVEEVCTKHGLTELSSQKEDEWLGTKEACEMLHASETTLWRWVCDGIIHRRKVGRHNFYSRDELKAIISFPKEIDNNKNKKR